MEESKENNFMIKVPYVPLERDISKVPNKCPSRREDGRCVNGLVCSRDIQECPLYKIDNL